MSPDIQTCTYEPVDPDTAEGDRHEQEHLVRKKRVDLPQQRVHGEQRQGVPEISRARQGKYRHAGKVRAGRKVEEQQVAGPEQWPATTNPRAPNQSHAGRSPVTAAFPGTRT
jgi:hypothetical protein